MLFSSMTFVFLFLPLVITLYYTFPRPLRNYILLAASILFYAWGEPTYCYVLLLIVAANYGGALLMSRFQSCRTFFFVAVLLINFGVLIRFKYMDFLLENLFLANLEGLNSFRAVLPIGISFYIFQSVSYLIDVYRKEIPAQRNFFKLSLFVALFPQMIAGPILKYHDIAPQIDHREIDLELFAYGVKRFIVGLAKKMLIANLMGAMADQFFERNNGVLYPSWMFWIGAVAYMFQIFYDFSGYSDMAIGLGAIFGFRFPENFNYPYISRTITEFWRRWHISLSSWFKEYLYIPLGGNRVSKARNYFNLFIVFLATGIWHGASWNFVLWGLWHGFFIILEKATDLHKKELSRTGRFFCHLYTLFVVLFGWVLFRANNLAEACSYVKHMFGIMESEPAMLNWMTLFDNEKIAVLLLAILCSCPVFRKMIDVPAQDAPGNSVRRPKIWKTILVDCWLMVLFVLSVMKIAASTYNPFIYFRF